MPHVSFSASLRAPAPDVWHQVADLSRLPAFHPACTRVDSMTPCEGRLGAERRCPQADGTTVHEKVIAWDEGRSFRVTLVEHALPVHWAEAGMRLERESAASTRVTVSMDYLPKYGALGRLLDRAVLRPRLSRMLEDMLQGLAARLLDSELAVAAA